MLEKTDGLIKRTHYFKKETLTRLENLSNKLTNNVGRHISKSSVIELLIGDADLKSLEQVIRKKF